MPRGRLEESLEQYLVRSILVVDGDQQSVNHLAGVLQSLSADPNAGQIIDASVSSLAAARAYIADRKPHTIIIDPSIDTVKASLDFMRDIREEHPHIVWVIDTHARWWVENDSYLDAHIDGKRIKEYYCMEKGRPETERRTAVLASLARCQHDIILNLFRESAAEVAANAVDKMTKPQLVKFTSKVFEALRALNMALGSRPGRGDIAFVSMHYVDARRAIYDNVIAPVLRKAGLTPVLIEREYPREGITEAILRRIRECSFFVSDLTDVRPDVLIEVGAAMSLTKKVILISEGPIDPSALPFMLRGKRIDSYSSGADLERQLRAALEAMQ